MERSYIFYDWQIKALQEGRLTQFSFPIKPQPDHCHRDIINKKYINIADWERLIPQYGNKEIKRPLQVGDIIRIKETWCDVIDPDAYWDREKNKRVVNYPTNRFYKIPSEMDSAGDYIIYYADGETEWCDDDGFMTDRSFWKHPSCMPKWASRYHLKVINVKVQRLQDMMDKDAYCEGINEFDDDKNGVALVHFINHWNSRFAKKGFGSEINPWRWVIEIKQIEE